MILFRCPKCGLRAADLEGHRCAPAPDRLEKARAVLSEASERVGAEYRPPPEAIKEVTPRKAAPEPRSGAARGFDRAKYQREYMRAWRARRKAGSTS
jgi:hypothetical protein